MHVSDRQIAGELLSTLTAAFDLAEAALLDRLARGSGEVPAHG